MHKKTLRYGLVFSVIFALGLSLSVMLFYEPEPPQRETALPQFSLPNLKTEIRVTNSDLRLPALLNIWASWCVSCRYEHPLFVELAEKGVRIYGINYQDERTDALQWLEEMGDPYHISIRDARGLLGARLGLYGVPETYYVNSDGEITVRHIGVVTEQVWLEKFAGLWAEHTGATQ